MSTLREEFDVWARTKYHPTDTVLDEFGGYNGDNVAGAWEGYQAATERAAKLCANLAHDAAIKYANGREVDFEQEVAAAIRGAEKEGAKGS